MKKTTPICTPCGVINLPVDGTPVHTGPRALARRYGHAQGLPKIGTQVKVKLPAGRDVQLVKVVRHTPDGRFVGANAANFERTFAVNRIVTASTPEGRRPGFEDDYVARWEDAGDE